ncbi:tlde1 domain-containing protein [Bradyrhizobium sp. Bra64]|uniref:tlde1 domain-containing protein n=1 Tax=Bradyrhizobium sp. Bra64 TaxID=2926009 RepID=UPI00211859A9|nr:tlde1 domain-containing protein [Bradyrhizobium sp. Bra64]
MTTQNALGAAVIGCVVLGAGWTVYSNIFAASVYPTVGSIGYDAPVIKRAPRVALREAGEAVKEAFALLPDRLQVAAPISREMFNERFAAAATQGVQSNAASVAPATKVAEAKDTAKPGVIAKVAEALKPAPARIADAGKDSAKDSARTKRADAPVQLASADPAEIVPAPEAKPKSFADRAKAAVMSITGPRQSMVDKLWGKREPSGGLLAYASADASVTASIAPREQNPMLGGSAPYERDTAVYDITARTVYLPDGTKLEAHSGLGSNLDDPRSSRVRMRGVTPPHIYMLKPREALFHGVPALRLTPIGGESAIYGRDGLLAHTFMLGPNGDSNGCVSFKDYYAFLDAYRNKGIRKLAVLARVE